MSEWATRLGLLFPDRAKVDTEIIADDASSDNLQNLALRRDYDEVKETKPTYEQISQERILDEANKNIQILKSLETILQERTQSYGTFFAAQGKYKPSYEIFQYCEGTLRQALDALFVFLEQVCSRLTSFLKKVRCSYNEETVVLTYQWIKSNRNSNRLGSNKL